MYVNVRIAVCWDVMPRVHQKEAARPLKMYKGTWSHIPKYHIYIVSFMSCVSGCMINLARTVNNYNTI